MSKEKKVIEYYNSFSRDYNGFYNKIQFQKFKNVLLEKNPISEWTIDHGGGTALLSEWLGYPLVTLDISELMLRVGKIKNKELQCIVGDMNKLPFRDNCINQILSFTALQNSSDQIIALEEIWRTSENKGIHLITLLEKKFNETIFNNWLESNQIKYEITNLSIEDILLSMTVVKY